MNKDYINPMFDELKARAGGYDKLAMNAQKEDEHLPLICRPTS